MNTRTMILAAALMFTGLALPQAQAAYVDGRIDIVGKFDPNSGVRHYYGVGVDLLKNS